MSDVAGVRRLGEGSVICGCGGPGGDGTTSQQGWLITSPCIPTTTCPPPSLLSIPRISFTLTLSPHLYTPLAQSHPPQPPPWHPRTSTSQPTPSCRSSSPSSACTTSRPRTFARACGLSGGSREVVVLSWCNLNLRPRQLDAHVRGRARRAHRRRAERKLSCNSSLTLARTYTPSSSPPLRRSRARRSPSASACRPSCVRGAA